METDWYNNGEQKDTAGQGVKFVTEQSREKAGFDTKKEIISFQSHNIQIKSLFTKRILMRRIRRLQV
jgi:hypothetical protein